MKKRHILLSLFTLLLLSACEKERDFTLLIGDWKSAEVTVRVFPDNPAMDALIRKEIEMYDYYLLFLEEESEFREYRYQGGQQLYYITGYYFYNNGYKAKYFLTNPFWGNRFLDVRMKNADELTAYFDAAKRYQDPETLHSLGITDPKSIRIDRVDVTITYRRHTSGQPN